MHSELGGNLRLRTAEVLVDANGDELPKASGDNKNTFYQSPKIKTPLISDKAEVKSLDLPEFYLYDIQTEKGEIYEFHVNNK